MREKIHYLKFCMSCSAGQAGHLASPLLFTIEITAWLARAYDFYARVAKDG